MNRKPPEENALEVARQRFFQAMPKKAEELRDIIQSLAADPYNTTRLDELRRALYALFASVQVFGMEDLAESLRGMLSKLDQRKESGIPIPHWELEELRVLAQRLSPRDAEWGKMGAPTSAVGYAASPSSTGSLLRVFPTLHGKNVMKKASRGSTRLYLLCRNRPRRDRGQSR